MDQTRQFDGFRSYSGRAQGFGSPTPSSVTPWVKGTGFGHSGGVQPSPELSGATTFDSASYELRAPGPHNINADMGQQQPGQLRSDHDIVSRLDYQRRRLKARRLEMEAYLYQRQQEWQPEESRQLQQKASTTPEIQTIVQASAAAASPPAPSLRQAPAVQRGTTTQTQANVPNKHSPLVGGSLPCFVPRMMPGGLAWNQRKNWKRAERRRRSQVAGEQGRIADLARENE